MSALIPAVDLAPTAELIATERERFARCANYDAAREELSVAMVHIEALAAALAAGHTLSAALRVQAMLAVRRAYDQRAAELDAAYAARKAATAVDTEPAADPDAEIRRLAELSAAGQERRTGGAQ